MMKVQTKAIVMNLMRVVATGIRMGVVMEREKESRLLFKLKFLFLPRPRARSTLTCGIQALTSSFNLVGT